MKKFLCVFIALPILISSLSAQSTDVPDNPTAPALSPAESYPIGTISRPVFAAEYCSFLSDINEPQTELSSDAVEQKYIGENTPIICSGTTGDFQFTISLPDQNNSLADESILHQVITTVPSSDVQYAFILWRQNPTTIELTSYLNDKYHLQWKTGSPAARPAYAEEANTLHTSYPNSTTLPLIDKIAANPEISLTFDFINDRQTSLFTISRNQFQWMDGLVSTLKKQTDYFHRPSNISHDGILMSDQ